MIAQILAEGAARFGLTLSSEQLLAFERYAQLLAEWNQKFNLTRIVELEEVAVKHFLDSLSVTVALPKTGAPLRVVDVGTGPGFPGLPLKIALPSLHLTLIESTGKKTTFLQHVVQALELKGVDIRHLRAEAAGRSPDYRERFDVVTARAVARLAVLAEYTLPLAAVGGRVIAQKGQIDPEERSEAANALSRLGGKIDRLLPVTVPGLEAERHLIVINKLRPTPKAFPRRPGVPNKEPL